MTDKDTLSPIGATQEAIREVRRTAVGVIIDQSMALLLMIVGYLSIMGLVLKFFKDEYIEAFKSHSVIVWILVIAPAVIVLSTNIIPAAIRQFRLNRLQEKSVHGHLLKPLYFRPSPRTELDRSEFRRQDGAHKVVCDWLLKTSGGVMYLTGRSGTGKTSLMQAFVIPEMREKGWEVLVVRSYEDPIQTMCGILENVDEKNPRRALETYLTKNGTCSKRTLMVLDQFEELVIMGVSDAVNRLRLFLHELLARPIEGLTLLLILRSDYSLALERLSLPPRDPQSNWKEIEPFDHSAARSFIENSGLEVSANTVEQMLDGLARLESTRGLYRPVTLNMLGLALQRYSGDRLRDLSPGRLIQHYIEESLNGLTIREFTPQILSKMITEAGTKEPRSIEMLAKETRLEPWQISGVLKELSSRDLVKPLNRELASWEISHDFVASVIGQSLGRMQTQKWGTLLRRIGIISFAVWFISLVLWTYYVANEIESRRNEEFLISELSDLGVFVQWLQYRGFRVFADHETNYSGDNAEEVLNMLKDIDVVELEIGSGSMDLSYLHYVPNVEFVDLNTVEVTNLAAISDLRNLRAFAIGARGRRTFSGLEKPNPDSLRNAGYDGVHTLHWSTLSRLEVLYLCGVGGFSNLEFLVGAKQLESLDVSFTELVSLSGVEALLSLREIDLRGTQIRDFSPLKDCRNLELVLLDNDDDLQEVIAWRRFNGLPKLETGLKGLKHWYKYSLPTN